MLSPLAVLPKFSPARLPLLAATGLLLATGPARADSAADPAPAPAASEEPTIYKMSLVFSEEMLRIYPDREIGLRRGSLRVEFRTTDLRSSAQSFPVNARIACDGASASLYLKSLDVEGLNGKKPSEANNFRFSGVYSGGASRSALNPISGTGVSFRSQETGLTLTGETITYHCGFKDFGSCGYWDTRPTSNRLSNCTLSLSIVKE